MAKTARRHFKVDKWTVSENTLSAKHPMVAESVFSLGNEYMGARGFLDERISSDTLVGSYLNGVYEYSLDKSHSGYKGIVTRTHYMVNACNYFDMELYVDGVRLDMAVTPYKDYNRTLNLKTGKLTRKLTWLVNGKQVTAEFCRFLDMQRFRRAYQQVTLSSDVECNVRLVANVRFDELHFGKPSRWVKKYADKNVIECVTSSTNQTVACAMACDVDGQSADDCQIEDKRISQTFDVRLSAGRKSMFTRLVAVSVGKDGSPQADAAVAELDDAVKETYAVASARLDGYWRDFWEKSDVEINGDDENQQGIRFCIFQLQQTYHGADPGDNIGAKGLTGEAYSGHAFWDTETYCLPYYLFNNSQAAKYLLEYRYATLPQARLRARDLDCLGACYPIATLNGEEACNLWQHASLQMQPTTAVAYGIYHYVNVTGDYEFLYGHGMEMLVEICRYLVTRGQWDATDSYFGYYAVMGPDEFQMMVNHNAYTNYMARKTFNFALDTLGKMPKDKLNDLKKAVAFDESEADEWRRCADKMLILYDDQTKLYEQHDGFYKLPHINVDEIADEDFPLYSHWSYDRIYRNDMIKQPDVLMFQLLYNGDFTKECKKANYEYYEPRCIHESSLSPSVHSILANEIGKYDEAYDFFAFATRMDLDDYNRNTREGLHTTSISAAWLNVVYGFGGLRSDKQISLSPTLPSKWKSYGFGLTVANVVLHISVFCDRVEIVNKTGVSVPLTVYGKRYDIVGKLTVKR